MNKSTCLMMKNYRVPVFFFNHISPLTPLKNTSVRQKTQPKSVCVGAGGGGITGKYILFSAYLFFFFFRSKLSFEIIKSVCYKIANVTPVSCHCIHYNTTLFFISVFSFKNFDKKFQFIKINRPGRR